MTRAAFSILVVEDEPEIRHVLRSSLTAAGYRVIEAENGKRALIEAASHKPDLVLLDLGLPDIDGVEVVKGIREWSALPVVVVSARNQETQKVAALDAGADDYVTKPFGAGELLARVRVALRHAARPADDGTPELKLGCVTVNLAGRRAWTSGGEIHLTPIEFKLLAALARHAGMVVTHSQLLREVWGPAHQERPHYLRVYMKQLREKLEADPVQPKYLLTDTGVGYRLKAEE
jgi:two-component system KDP operon response regulator KdpE